MNEIIRIHIAKMPYEIEVSAKKELTNYFDDLKKYCNDDEIINDVEVRVTEILQDLNVEKNGIISLKEVEKIKEQIGDAKLFAGDEVAEVDDEQKSSSDKMEREPKKIFRDTQNGIFGGIASGLSLYLNMDVAFIRIVMIILLIISFGWASMLYLIMWIIIPKAKNANDIIKLKGKKVTANEIKEINREYDFERSDLRNRQFLRVLGIIMGFFFVFLAFCGVITLLLVDISATNGIMEMFGAGFILANIAGVIFVAFCSFAAYVCFKAKVSTSQIIALILMAVLGLTSFTSGIVIEGANFQQNEQKIRENMISEKLEIDSAKLKNINSIVVDSNVGVEYIVGENVKVENYRYKFDEYNDKENIKFDFDDKNLKISFEKNWMVAGLNQKIRIYGPELSSIDAKSGSLKYSVKSQKELNIKLHENTSVNMPERSSIEKFNLETENYTELSAENVTVNTFMAELGKNATINLREAKESQIESIRCSEDPGSELFLRRGSYDNIKINGARYSAMDENCVNVVIDYKNEEEK